MSVCKTCGRQNQDLYKFCLGCGGELGASPESKLPATTATAEMAATPPTSPALNDDADDAERDRDQSADLERAPTGKKAPAAHAALESIPPHDTVREDPELTDRRDSLAHLKPYTDLDVGAPPPAVRLCPQCSHEVPLEFTFCGQCGARLEATTAASPNLPANGSSGRVSSLAASRSAAGKLVLIRPDGSEGGTHPLVEGENVVGRGRGALFDADGYLSPRHAELVLNAAGLVVRDTGSLNGVFVRIDGEEPLVDGDIFRIGQELLRFDEIPAPVPLDDGTDVMGSPNPGYWGRLALIVGRDQDGSAFPMFGDAVTLGRERGDILFPEDGYVSGQHARVAIRDGHFWLEDLRSSNGTFMRVRGERAVPPGTSILMGQQLFRVSY